MPVADITVKFVKSLPPLPDGKDKLRYFDNRLTGFVVEQRLSCVTFYFRYNDDRGRARDVKLGRFGDVTVEAARKRAEQLRADVSLGGDPVAAADRRRAVPTLAELIEERYLPHAKERMRSWGNVDAYCRLRIVPRLGRKRLDEITQQDVADFRRRLIDDGLSPSSVNRHLATLRSIYNLARKWGVYDGVIGQGVYEMVRTFYPAAKAITYSVEVKGRMVLKAKHLISRKLLEFDSGATDVVAAFLSIRKTMTASGRQQTFAASRSDE